MKLLAEIAVTYLLIAVLTFAWSMSLNGPGDRFTFESMKMAGRLSIEWPVLLLLAATFKPWLVVLFVPLAGSIFAAVHWFFR